MDIDRAGLPSVLRLLAASFLGLVFDHTVFETWRDYTLTNISGIPGPIVAGLMCNAKRGRKHTTTSFFAYTAVKTSATELTARGLIKELQTSTTLAFSVLLPERPNAMCDFSNYAGTSDEWLALEASLPPTTGQEMSLSELRRITNHEREAQSASAMKHLAHLVRIRDHLIPARDGNFIEARSYRPANVCSETRLPVYMHLQGGGFMFGTLDGEDAACARVAIGSRVAVLNVNYRHTPEHTYPIPWDDAEDAFEWAHDNMDKFAGDAEKVIVGGISAGAWVAASLTLQRHIARGTDARPPIAGQVLMIPCLAYPDCYEPQLEKMKHRSLSSYKQNEKAPLLSVSDLRLFTDLLKVTNPDAKDTKLNPGNASPAQVKGMPPTVLGIVGLDPLRDEALLYAKMLAEAGVPTDVNLFLGLPHGFRWYDEKISASRRWDKVVEEGVLWALTEPAPNNELHIKT
ncbi:hypothetical protein AK830_g10026 [Neonectria ditissima]|uniref:Alpha/beta hydrolase fold-3 domain-containing protein n=1 Tax=Neonectria ditissima TaxID=78410 RepID=A0A0P7AGP9_9HYPO|nr:hypothetical protein AK830_g10026 [Neonectria ditissima]